MTDALRRWFAFPSEQTIGAEVRAGVTTFLTVAYILFVNPDILGQAIVIEGVDVRGQLMTTTALAAAVGCLIMGVVARYPFALAPGMGLNAYFAFSVVGAGVPWRTALGAVFISGLLFLLISVIGLREILVNAIPPAIKTATTAGIGLFLAFIGCRGMGLVVDHPATLVTLGDLGSAQFLLGLTGLGVTATLMARRIRGAILIGILVTTVLAVLTGAPVYAGAPFAGVSEGLIRAPIWPVDLAFSLDLSGALELGLVGIVFVFLFVDFFDTAGTLLGLADRCELTTPDGRLPRAGLAFLADAIATVVGAVLGTSSTTTYVESAAGIEDGGRTGLTAVVVALCFLGAVFLSPVAALVPGVATAPALVLIGALMMAGVARIPWSDLLIAVPAFLTVIGMPLTYSIANGISFGIISHTVLHLLAGRWRDVHWLMAVMSALLLLRYAYLAG